MLIWLTGLGMMGLVGGEPVAVTWPVADLTWDGGQRADVTISTDQLTPAGEPCALVTMTGPAVPEQRHAEALSVVARPRPPVDPALAGRRVARFEFQFRVLDPNPDFLIVVAQRGYGQQIPLAEAGWQTVSSDQLGPRRPSLRDLTQLAWRAATVPQGCRFLIGPITVWLEADDLLWRPGHAPPFKVNGLPWLGENEGSYRRLPERARAADEKVWNVAQWPAGGRVRLITDSPVVRLRLNHAGSSFAWPQMSAMALAGVEWYEGPPEAMIWRGIVTPLSNTETYEATLLDGQSPRRRELTLYLPCYARLSQFEIGLAADAQIEPPSAFRRPRPVVFYGTSFVNGGCASRGSMNFPAILGRMLGVDIVNLGFAGDGRCEPEIAACVAEVDAACFVMGPILNAPELMAERYPAFVDTIRAAHPTTPIVLMTRLHTLGVTAPYAVNSLVEQVWRERREAGDKHIHLFDSFPLYGDGPFHPTVEGVHPTDLGFKLIADAIAPLLAEVLSLPAG